MLTFWIEDNPSTAFDSDGFDVAGRDEHSVRQQGEALTLIVVIECFPRTHDGERRALVELVILAHAVRMRGIRLEQWEPTASHSVGVGKELLAIGGQRPRE